MSLAGSAGAPQARAREVIDRQVETAGWVIQNPDEMNVPAGVGVAVRKLKVVPGHGFVDYLLFVDGRAVGDLRAGPEQIESVLGDPQERARVVGG
jgi:type I restriction enzyme R subunit